MFIKYKNYGIEELEDEFSVQYREDDVLFATLEDAKAFIDEITTEEE